MKYIVYVSQVVTRRNGATVPAGLSKIFSIARRSNAKFGITGVLSYRKGYYIQVIEGDEVAVDQLFKNISQDQRHENVTVLWTGHISQRAFPNWDMKLLESVKNDTHFQRFLEKNASAVQAMPPEKFALFEHFLWRQNRGNDGFSDFAGTELGLKAWPDFTKLTPSPVVIELCARLIKRPHSYDALLNSGDFGTKQQVDKILEKFTAHGVLNVTALTAQSTGYPHLEQPTGFYSKMKSFFGLD